MVAKSESSVDQELKLLAGRLIAVQQDIVWMRKLGGFTDAKTLAVRSSRLEDRVERLERDNAMLVDQISHLAEFVSAHVRDRHLIDLAARGENSTDVIVVRRIKRREVEWQEACRPKQRVSAAE